MKNFRQLLWIAVLLFSIACKDDDDSSPQNFVIGTWQPLIAYGEGEFYEFSECEKQARVIFGADGSYSSTMYSEISSDGISWECTLIGSGTGMWEELVPNQYSISSISATPVSGTIEIISIHRDTIRFRKDEDNYADYSRL